MLVNDDLNLWLIISSLGDNHSIVANLIFLIDIGNKLLHSMCDMFFQKSVHGWIENRVSLLVTISFSRNPEHFHLWFVEFSKEFSFFSQRLFHRIINGPFQIIVKASFWHFFLLLDLFQMLDISPLIQFIYCNEMILLAIFKVER